MYPTHLRLVYDSTGTILAILYREVPQMLHAHLVAKSAQCSGEEVV